MKVSEQLAGFVEKSLEAGKSRDEIRDALKAAGWMETEIDAALSAWSEVEFSPPLPRPKSNVSAREAFYFILMYVLLSAMVWFLIDLAFELANGLVKFQNGTIFRIWGYSLSSIRYSMSALVIVFPVFLTMNAVSQRRIAVDPAKQRSQVQKWLGYLALAVAALSLVGDAVWIVFGYVSGSFTLLFWYRALIVAAVAATIFLFFLHENREPSTKDRSLTKTGLNGYQLALAVLVTVTIVGGWIASEGLAGARMEARDQDRQDDLRRIVNFTICVADAAGGQLPIQLVDDNVCRASAQLRPNAFGQGFQDRFTGEPYRFAKVSEFEFKICAVLERPQAAAFFFHVFDAPWACAQIHYSPPKED